MKVALVILLLIGQPVSFQVQDGPRPTLKVAATQPITELRIELRRGDGKTFTHERPALARGQTASFAIGDGAPGKASYEGTISAQVGADKWSEKLTFETFVAAPLHVGYDREHLDLDKRVLQFKLSRPAGSAELVAIGEDGKELGTGKATYASEPPNTWLPITWTQPAGTRVMMLKLRAVSAEGLATNVELIPWSVTVEHEDVNFATDSSVIAPAEEPKLDASLAKIRETIARSERFMKLKLYVAGHTDTVGAGAKNRKLSLDRARSIASYFRRKGLAIPIAVAGFGEDVLKKKTPDATDELINRRADYVLGPAAGTPPFSGPYLAARATWQQLR